MWWLGYAVKSIYRRWYSVCGLRRTALYRQTTSYAVYVLLCSLRDICQTRSEWGAKLDYVRLFATALHRRATSDVEISLRSHQRCAWLLTALCTVQLVCSSSAPPVLRLLVHNTSLLLSVAQCCSDVRQVPSCCVWCSPTLVATTRLSKYTACLFTVANLHGTPAVSQLHCYLLSDTLIVLVTHLSPQKQTKLINRILCISLHVNHPMEAAIPAARLRLPAHIGHTTIANSTTAVPLPVNAAARHYWYAKHKHFCCLQTDDTLKLPYHLEMNDLKQKCF